MEESRPLSALSKEFRLLSEVLDAAAVEEVDVVDERRVSSELVLCELETSMFFTFPWNVPGDHAAAKALFARALHGPGLAIWTTVCRGLLHAAKGKDWASPIRALGLRSGPI